MRHNKAPKLMEWTSVVSTHTRQLSTETNVLYFRHFAPNSLSSGHITIVESIETTEIHKTFTLCNNLSTILEYIMVSQSKANKKT